MACINMFNADHQAGALGPRISFSNDFSVEPPPAPAQPPRSQCLPVSDPDFEFSVGSHQMIAADQIFSKGRILPLKDSTSSSRFSYRPPTLRDELRGQLGDDVERGSKQQQQGHAHSLRWKEFLGMNKKGHKTSASFSAVESAVLHTDNNTNNNNVIQEQS